MSDVYQENYQLKKENNRLQGEASDLRERVRVLERDIADITPRVKRRRGRVEEIVRELLIAMPPREAGAIANAIDRIIASEIRDYEMACRYVSRGIDLQGTIMEAKKDILTESIREVLRVTGRTSEGMAPFYVLQEILRRETGEGYKGEV